eukprot:Mrub_07002.p1 GENE.Mrub_07002~~Mrub_07002.p1  ORF type:complete len:312 (+),score=15.95 Mrub_07002:26-937(+)
MIQDFYIIDKIVCGGNHSAYLSSHGNLVLSGNNEFGQCDTPNLGYRFVVQVSCGYDSTCLLLDDGSIRIFGNDEYGQCQTLKLETEITAKLNVDNNIHACYSTTAQSFDSHRYTHSYKAKQLGDRKVSKIACGNDQTFLILDDNSMLIVVEGTNELTLLDSVNLPGQNIVQVAGGYNHYCILLDDGKVRMSGGNESGQCNIPSLGGRLVVQVACGVRFTCLLLEDGSLCLFGSNQFGQCNVPNLNNVQVLQISCGFHHTGLLLSNDLCYKSYLENISISQQYSLYLSYNIRIKSFILDNVGVI